MGRRRRRNPHSPLRRLRPYHWQLLRRVLREGTRPRQPLGTRPAHSPEHCLRRQARGSRPLLPENGVGSPSAPPVIRLPLVSTSLGRNQISLLCVCRIWRLLVIREPPSDSDYTPRRINGVVQSPQHLWDVGCRIYMTAVPDDFRAWRTEAKLSLIHISEPTRPY